jgi:hypothetical protein
MTVRADRARPARLAAGVLAAVAVIELASAILVLAFGPMTWRVGPMPILLHSAVKSVAIAVVMGSIALALFEPTLPEAVRAPIGAATRSAAYAALALGFASVAAPCLAPGFNVGHDFGAHQTYMFLFDRALGQGQFPVRWVEHVTFGTAQPLFNFYQVGFYYLVALVHAGGLPLTTAFKTVVVGQWAVGTVFVFLLCRPYGEMPAAAAAAVFLFTPYVMLDAYVRTAYPELTAIGFVPAVLWSIDRVLRRGRPLFVFTLALFTMLLVISHMPTALIVVPGAILFSAALVAALPARAIRVAAVAAGALLGVAMSAFYTMPALLELDLIKLRRLTAGYFDYHVHFVAPRAWFDWSWGYGGSAMAAIEPMSVQIGIAQWSVLIAGVCLIAVPKLCRRSLVPTVVLALAMAAIAAAMFMMTSRSAAVWEHIPPMAFIQFPWRLLMVPAVFCPIVAAAAVSTMRAPTLQALAVICAVAMQWHLTDTYRDKAWIRREAIGINDPKWADTDNGRLRGFREMSYDPISVPGEPSATRDRWSIEGPSSARVQVSPEIVKDARLVLDAKSAEPAALVINTPMFAGWHVTLDGEEIQPAIQASTGYMIVTLPAGAHVIAAELRRTRVRMIAEIVSAAAIAVWLAGLAAALGRARR